MSPPDPAVEYRSYAGPEAGAEIRQGSAGRRIGGYASVFNKLSRNLGGFVERVDPSAFDKSRRYGWPGVLARYNHNPDALLGTTGAGTLTLSIDRTGLSYMIEMPRTRDDVLELVQRGDVRNSSFAFLSGVNVVDDWSVTPQNYPLRTLLSVQLVDVAPTSSPAYPDATAGLRSLAARFDVPLDEVRTLAEQNALTKLFPKKLHGRTARALVLAGPPDPWAVVA